MRKGVEVCFKKTSFRTLMYLVLIIFRLLVLHVESLSFLLKSLWKVQKLFIFFFFFFSPKGIIGLSNQ